LLIGSNTPSELEWPAFEERLRQPLVQGQLKRIGRQAPTVFLSHFVATSQALRQLDLYRTSRLNVDDTCRIEFAAPRDFYELDGRLSSDLIFSWRQSPAAIFRRASLSAPIKERLDRMPRARKLLIEGMELIKKRQFERAARAYERAVALNPDDPIIREHAMHFYADMARHAADQKTIYQQLRQALGQYEALGIFMNRSELYPLLNYTRQMARANGDEATAERCTLHIRNLDGHH
jgi:tetratricopeptide (TPR) repeat protein